MANRTSENPGRDLSAVKITLPNGLHAEVVKNARRRGERLWAVYARAIKAELRRLEREEASSG